jgi:hypothetical protein
MQYIVIKSFFDKEDNNTHYKIGEEFPKGDSKPNKKRIEELLNTHPKYNVAFIEKVKDVKKPSKSSTKE